MTSLLRKGSNMLEKKARTVAEVIEYLQGWNDQNQKVAFTVYTRDDIEHYSEEYKMPSIPEGWDSIVDEMQDALDEGWLVEQVSEEIGNALNRHFELED